MFVIRPSRRPVRTRRGRVALAGAAPVAALLMVLGSVVPAQASVSATPTPTAMTDGAVRALAVGTGRTFIGGQFTRVGGRTRTNLAAIRTDGTVDPSFNTAVDGMVKALALSPDGSTLYIGGLFTTVAGEPRANLAAIDVATSTVLPAWSADTSGAAPDVESLALSPDGATLYAGGKFVGIDGTTRKRLVAVGAASGDVISTFRAAPNGTVKEVIVSPDGSHLYAGGGFVAIGGQQRPSGAAELSAATGAATAFDPTGDGGGVVTVELTPDGSQFFYSSGNNTIFAYNLTTGQPMWTRKMSGNTQAMAATADGELYVGGHFSQNLDTKTKRPYFASFRISDGALTSWAPQAVGGKMGCWALELDGSTLHAGGVFTYFGGVRQRGYARFVA